MMEVEEWEKSIETFLHSAREQSRVNVARAAGILTLMGSGYIIQDIAKDAARRKPTKNRIILFMSICDFLFGFFNSMLGPVMAPRDTGAPGAVGNVASCTLQGFLSYTPGFASSLFNVSLALCYLLMVRYEFSDERLRNLEKYFLYLPIGLSLIIAISALPFQVYNFGGQSCALNYSPLFCDRDDSPVDCQRGELHTYWLLTYSAGIFLSAVSIITSMVLMFMTILQRERSGDRFRFTAPAAASSPARGRPRRDLTNTMRNQGLWYSGAYLFSFAPLVLKELIPNDASWLQFLATTTINVLGFTNAVIYIRPRFLKFRKDFPAISISSSLWHTLARTGPPRCPGSTTGRGGGRGSTGGSSTPSRQNHARNEQNRSHLPHSFLLFHRGLMSRMRSFLGAPVRKEVEASLRVQEQEEGVNHAGDDQMDSNNDNKESFLLDSVHHHGKDNHVELERDGIHADFDSDKNIGKDIDEMESENSQRNIDTTLSAIEEVKHWSNRGLIRGDSDKRIGSNDDISEQFHDDVIADAGLEFDNNRRSIEEILKRSFTGE